MAIAPDTTTTSITTGFNAGPTTKTFNHTCTGSNLLLVFEIAIWQDVAGTGSVTSASYNGVALTSAGAANTEVSMRSEIWYLIAPTSGSSLVCSVTVTG